MSTSQVQQDQYPVSKRVMEEVIDAYLAGFKGANPEDASIQSISELGIVLPVERWCKFTVSHDLKERSLTVEASKVRERHSGVIRERGQILLKPGDSGYFVSTDFRTDGREGQFLDEKTGEIYWVSVPASRSVVKTDPLKPEELERLRQAN